MSSSIIVPSLPAGYDMLQPALGTKVCTLRRFVPRDGVLVSWFV